MFTAVGNHALPACVCALGVTVRLVPLIEAFPFTTIDPEVNPLPKLIPPPPPLLMVYTAVPTPLSLYPLLEAMALSVSLELTETAELYTAELCVGVFPFVV